MAEIRDTLVHGLKVGDTENKDFVMDEIDLGGVLDANTAAEMIREFVDHSGELRAELVVSPTLVGIETLRRQIKSIGEVPGPIPMELMRKLKPADVKILQAAADRLEDATVDSVEKRGRAEASS